MKWLMALLLLVPLAAAQAPEAEWTLGLQTPAPASVRPDSATSLTWTLEVSGSGMICPQEATAVVLWRIADAKDGAGALVETPQNTTVTIPQGAYLLDDFEAQYDITTNLLVSRFAEQGSNLSFEVTAHLELDDSTCTPEGPEPEAVASFTVHVEVVPEGEALYHPSHEEHADALDAYVEAGQSFTHTFEEPESITYHDHLDPSRKGEVHVEEGGNASAEVTIDAQGYSPATIRIAPGATVTWRNVDDRTHTVSFDELHGGEETELGGASGTNAPAEKSKGAPGVGVVGVVAAVALALLRRRS